MKTFLIGFAIYFALAFLPQYVRYLIKRIKFMRAKKRAKESEKWMFEV